MKTSFHRMTDKAQHTSLLLCIARLQVEPFRMRCAHQKLCF